jgi:undecaprenyl-diphosphatase
MDLLNQKLFYLIYNFGKENFLLVDFEVFLAKYLSYFLVLFFVYLIFSEKFYHEKKVKLSKQVKLFLFLETILALILSRGIITELIRFFYPIKRPFDVLGIKSFIFESGSSFPSGHSAFFFALATIIFIWNKKYGLIYFILGIINGLSRIAVGVHWPLDILGGFVIGILSALLVHLVLNKDFKKFKFKE